MVKHNISTKAAVGLGLALAVAPVSARAADAYMPIVVPVTGFMSVAGGSPAQRRRYGGAKRAFGPQG